MANNMSRSPWVIHYDGSSCNGCDIEVLAALTPLFDAERFGVVNTGNPKHADIFLVTGSANAQNAPVIRQIYEQMVEPKVVVACGVCACSGGVFRDCYNVAGGVDRVVPVDVYAPGCAIRPESIIDAVVEACGVLDQKEQVLRAGGDPLSVGGAATWDGGDPAFRTRASNAADAAGIAHKEGCVEPDGEAGFEGESVEGRAEGAGASAGSAVKGADVPVGGVDKGTGGTTSAAGASDESDVSPEPGKKGE